jgi:immune inhibitor A
LLSLSLASGISLVLGPSAIASPPVDVKPAAAPAKKTPVGDELPNELEEKRRELRQKALDLVLTGKAKPEKRGASTVVKVGRTVDQRVTGKSLSAKGATAAPTKDQYVELKREKSDKIFVVLTEFGNERHPNFPDKDTDPATPGPATFEGPLVNKIPEPDRTKDNSTVWQPDYNRAHYQKMYFGTGKGVESLRTYYETQSSGRYSVNGTVTDWVKVKYNEARYGRSNDNPTDANGDDPNVCASSNCTNVWELTKDGLNQWVADQKAKGRTDAQIKAEVAKFDEHDRYDFDGDGNFNEADGYLDHFQIVHAGGDQADGDPQQGEDAVWSHRWYAFATDIGRTGPANNPLGGAQIGNTGIWAGDYTIQPENGGRSVFFHEYGHDLGLPDDYDTSGGGDNNSEYWTLMAQSRLGAKKDQGIGERAGDFGQWQKMQLGWLDYEVVNAGQTRTLTLGPAEYNSAKPQGLVVVLPKKKVTTDLGAPFAGTKQWFSGNADNLDNSITREVDLTGKTSGALAAKVRYAIEEGYDYLYVEASTNGGTSWTALDGTVDGKPLPRDASGTPALDGTSAGKWVDLNIPLNSVAGKKALVRYHYRTDGGVSDGGLFADEIKVVADGATVFTDGAESGDNGWTVKGFSAVGASITAEYDNYYLATNRTYTGYDRYLKTGPYNFGYANTKPDWVEHYAYQTGLLVSYWDTSQVDNNTNVHPGQGLHMIVDSRPRPVYNLNGVPWRARIQMYDAPFGLTKADSMTLHINGKASLYRGQDAAATFDDTRKYWYAELPNHGVKLPAVGVRIQVLEQDGTSVKIRVSAKK